MIHTARIIAAALLEEYKGGTIHLANGVLNDDEILDLCAQMAARVCNYWANDTQLRQREMAAAESQVFCNINAESDRFVSFATVQVKPTEGDSDK